MAELTTARGRAPVVRETDTLSRALTRVLAEQRGPEFVERLRWLHRAAADVRAGVEGAGEALAEGLRELGDDEVEPYIRACSLQLQLANIAEERERIRRRRQYDTDGDLQRESLAETAQRLAATGVEPGDALKSLRVELVLPTRQGGATTLAGG